MAALVLGFALVFSSLPAAWAAAPPSSAMEIRRIDFESGSVDQALPLIVAGAPQPMAYWGVISNTALSGTKSLWCAGTTYPGGVNPSAFWSTYATATAGDAWVRVPQTADYYDSWIRFAYSMPTKGSQDFFSSILLNGSDSPLYAHADLATTAPGAWAVDTWRLGANGRARTAAGLMLRFVDQYEVIGGSESAGRDDRGQGPAVDDIVVTGYKYGPVRNLTANRVSGHVELTWAKPQMTPTNTAQDTRSMAYRVWRTDAGVPGVWTELTGVEGASRTSALTFTDATPSSLAARYFVQAWDTGTGQGYGAGDPSVDYVVAPGDNVLPNVTSFTVGGGAATTTAITMQAQQAVSNVTQMQFSTDASATWSAWVAYAPTASVTVTAGLGPKTVLAHFRNGNGIVEAADGIEVVAAPVSGLSVSAADFSNTVAYNIKSLLTTKMHFTASKANVRAKLEVMVPGATWKIYDGATSNQAGVPYELPAWNGKSPTGAKVPFASSYSWRLTVSSPGEPAVVKTGKILLCNVYFAAKGTSAGVTNLHKGYLIGSAASPMSVNIYVSASSTAPSDQLSIRVTGPNGYAATPSSTPWKIPSAPGTATPRLTGATAIKANATYDFRVTGKTNVTYTISVIE